MATSPESSNLVRLIRSLKQGEKRFITLELSRYKKENNLLKLYQLISNTDSITDTAIRKKIRDKKFITQLSINKHKLYNAILEALQQLHLKSSPYYQASNLIDQSYFLQARGLFMAKEELLLKAIVIAEKYELRELQLQAIQLQQLNHNNDAVMFVQSVDRILQQIKNERKLNQLFNSCLTSESTPGTRFNTLQRAGLKKLMDEALSMKSDSFTASYYRLRICFTYYAIPGDHQFSYHYSQLLLSLFQQYPHMLDIETWRIEYIETLRNSIPALTFYGKAAQREFIYNEAKRLDIPDMFKASLVINILDSHIQSGEYQENEKKLNDIQNHIEFYDLHLSFSNKLILYFNLAILNFGLGNYSKSLFWLNEILNTQRARSFNISLNIMTRLFRLLVFYEMGHMDMLENHLRSTSRFLAKQDTQYQIDQLILKCLKKMGSTTDKKEFLQLVKQTRNELVKLSKDPDESRALDYFDFISWLNAKLGDCSFTDAIKEKNAERLKKFKSL